MTFHRARARVNCGGHSYSVVDLINTASLCAFHSESFVILAPPSATSPGLAAFALISPITLLRY